jgi:hypothetical protein
MIFGQTIPHFRPSARDQRIAIATEQDRGCGDDTKIKKMKATSSGA